MRRVIDRDLPGFVAKLAEVLELQGVKLSPALRKAAAKDRAAFWAARTEARRITQPGYQRALRREKKLRDQRERRN